MGAKVSRGGRQIRKVGEGRGSAEVRTLAAELSERLRPELDRVVGARRADRIVGRISEVLQHEIGGRPRVDSGIRERWVAPPDQEPVRSPAMLETLRLVERYAASEATVLVSGESGSGKERIARQIHRLSPRGAGPFVAINCAAMPETLIESELFGWVRGAFTGATSDREGLFESASGGTLLLDEIGEMSPALQAKLLRALQEGEIRRVGGTGTVKVDVRVIAATNRDLAESVAKGQFREDLYYRLRVLSLRVPPLRERPADVLPLADEMLRDASRQMGRTFRGFSADARVALERHDWPGNVRELENAILRACVFSSGDEVGLEDLPTEVRPR